MSQWTVYAGTKAFTFESDDPADNADRQAVLLVLRDVSIELAQDSDQRRRDIWRAIYDSTSSHARLKKVRMRNMNRIIQLNRETRFPAFVGPALDTLRASDKDSLEDADGQRQLEEAWAKYK